MDDVIDGCGLDKVGGMTIEGVLLMGGVKIEVLLTSGSD